MHKLYTFFFCLFFLWQAAEAKLYEGYIITKTNYQLTGKIGSINQGEFGSIVEFVNDFGTPYFLHPALIKGFVVEDGPRLQLYESKYWKNEWMFLRVVFPGQNLRLLRSPEEVVNYDIVNGRLISETREINEYWLEIPGKRMFLVRRLNFRRKMRRLISEVSPALAEQIGQPGYRYKDLYQIVKEYERQCNLGKRRL